MIGICDYGFYVPRYRISTEEIARHWGKNPEQILNSLGIVEKAIGGADEDSLTMAYESAVMALCDSDIDRKQIGAVFVGSETHPYAVNPTATILVEYLDIGNDYLAYDTQFACKAATGAIISALAHVKAGFSQYVLVSGTDKATGQPGDALEYSAGSAAVTCIIGSKNVLLEYIDSTSFSSDTPDFWRRSGISHPSHAGRFTGEPAYFHHIFGAVNSLLKKTRLKPKDFTRIIFHMPNGVFPVKAALRLGFTEAQVKESLVVKQLGNSYSASALMGLCAVLEISQPGERILFASYGSGAGSDAFAFKVTKHILQKRKLLSKLLERKENISYDTYRKFL